MSSSQVITLSPELIGQLLTTPNTVDKRVASITKAFGEQIGLIAQNMEEEFAFQRKFRTFFFSSFAQHMIYRGEKEPVTLIAKPFEMKNSAFDDDITRYFVNPFAIDDKIIESMRIQLDVPLRSVESFESTPRQILNMLHITMPIIRNGDRAICTQAEFRARLDKYTRAKSGELDPILNDIFARSGIDNYCIAGGFIAKLMDPHMMEDDIKLSDVDIFVYGPAQHALIDSLISKLFVQGQTFITINGSVITVHRKGFRRVQIISSGYMNAYDVIADFDIASVMYAYINDTVWCTASAIHALQTRISHHPSPRKLVVSRVIKMFKNGFHFMEDSTISSDFRSEICKHNKIKEVIANYLNQPILKAHMTNDECQTRIMISQYGITTHVITELNPEIPISMRIAHGFKSGANTGSYTIDVDQLRPELFTAENLEFIGDEHYALTLANRKVIISCTPITRTRAETGARVIVAARDTAVTITKSIIDMLRPLLGAKGITLDTSMIDIGEDMCTFNTRIIDEDRFDFDREPRKVTIQLNLHAPSANARKLVPMLVHEH